MITINLVLRSQLKKIIGKDEIVIQIEKGSNFIALAEGLCIKYDHTLRNILFSEKYGFMWLCIKNRKRVLPDEILEDGDKLILLPPLAGG